MPGISLLSLLVILLCGLRLVAAEWDGTSYFVREGNGYTKVTDVLNMPKPMFWWVYYYKRGAACGGDKSGIWGSDYNESLPKLIDSVKRAEENERKELSRGSSTEQPLSTTLNALYPVADFGYVKPKQTADEDKAGNKSPYPEQQERYDGALNTAASLFATYNGLLSVYASNPSGGTPGMASLRYMELLRGSMDQVVHLSAQLKDGLTLPQSVFIDKLNQLEAELNQSSALIAKLRAPTPELPATGKARNPFLEDGPGISPAKSADAVNPFVQEAQTSTPKSDASANPFLAAGTTKAIATNPLLPGSGSSGGNINPAAENPFVQESRKEALAKLEAEREEARRELARLEEEQQRERLDALRRELASSSEPTPPARLEEEPADSFPSLSPERKPSEADLEWQREADAQDRRMAEARSRPSTTFKDITDSFSRIDVGNTHINSSLLGSTTERSSPSRPTHSSPGRAVAEANLDRPTSSEPSSRSREAKTEPTRRSVTPNSDYFAQSGNARLAQLGRGTEDKGDLQLWSYCATAMSHYKVYVMACEMGAKPETREQHWVAHRKTADIAIAYDRRMNAK